MPTDLHTKIYNFLLNAEEENITAGSVIYQGIKNNPWISQNELKTIIERAVTFAKNQYERGSSRHTTLLEILPKVRYKILIIMELLTRYYAVPKGLAHYAS